MRRIGSVAYELELPSSARIHPVFHVSLLKQCHGPPSLQVTPLPPTTATSSSAPLPIRVLGQRVLPDSSDSQMEFLVQQEGQDVSEATWVPKSHFEELSPTFDLEDKIFSRDSGNVASQNVAVRKLELSKYK